jgi:hypothetical protein
MSETRLLPREHGTWAMLLVPWVVGCGIAGRLTAGAVMLLAGSVALFMAHNALVAWYRARPGSGTRSAAGWWLLVLGGLGLALLAPVAVAFPPLLLAGLALAGVLLLGISLALVARRLDHALPGQALAAVGLTLNAPAAYHAAGGARGVEALALWLLDVVFFLWAVYYVRLKIEARARRGGLGRPSARLAFSLPTLAVDAVLGVAAFAALRMAGLPALGLIAFVPAALQALAGVARLHRPAVLKRVGFLMLAHSIAFALLLVALV